MITQKENGNSYAVYDDEEARQYLCRACNAVIVTDNHTAVEACPFCGNTMTLGERIAGDYGPCKLIPFRVSRAMAKRAYRKWYLKLKFSPKDFPRELRKKEPIGMYLPVWLFTTHCEGDVLYSCTRSVTQKEKKERVTDTEHYYVKRQFELSFDRIPINASQKLPDRLVEGLFPYRADTWTPFSVSQLSRFYSEKYHMSDRELADKARRQTEEYADIYLKHNLPGYDTSQIFERQYRTEETASEYALIPVWLVYQNKEDADYLFAMNGQTGQIALTPPISVPRTAIAAGLILFFAFLLCRIVTLLLGGPLI